MCRGQRGRGDCDIKRNHRYNVQSIKKNRHFIISIIMYQVYIYKKKVVHGII